MELFTAYRINCSWEATDLSSPGSDNKAFLCRLCFTIKWEEKNLTCIVLKHSGFKLNFFCTYNYLESPFQDFTVLMIRHLPSVIWIIIGKNCYWSMKHSDHILWCHLPNLQGDLNDLTVQSDCVHLELILTEFHTGCTQKNVCRNAALSVDCHCSGQEMRYFSVGFFLSTWMDCDIILYLGLESKRV